MLCLLLVAVVVNWLMTAGCRCWLLLVVVVVFVVGCCCCECADVCWLLSLAGGGCFWCVWCWLLVLLIG